jgi:very-short-patch-repair endonuclease
VIATPVYRDVSSEGRSEARAGRGRMCVSVIGIDRYRDRAWEPLRNAASDARGALRAFSALGFEPVGTQLFDEAATCDALRRLVIDDLQVLGDDDSLVLFFAGHGHTVPRKFPDGTCTKKGYLIPVDAVEGRMATWVALDQWLSDVARLRPRHILVVVDACHSGIALEPIIRWRGKDMRLSESLERVNARRSRRIITSALDGELAMDNGPRPGHSLFTGCLIDALTGGLRESGKTVARGSDIWHHVRDRVVEYPTAKQTPDYGAFELDDRGELLVSLVSAESSTERPACEPVAAKPRRTPRSIAAVGGSQRRERAPRVQPWRQLEGPPRRKSAPRVAVAAQDRREPATSTPATSAPATSAPATSTSTTSTLATSASPVSAPAVSTPSANPTATSAPLDPSVRAALDRHDAERRHGDSVLSILAGDATTALTAWASWAADHGYMTLTTEATGLDASVAELLAQTPWLRALPAARARLAAAAQLDVNEVDAAIDARSGDELAHWLDDVTAGDPHARVSGWLLSSLRAPLAAVPDLATAPVRGSELLAVVSDLAVPIAVIAHHPAPTVDWLRRAIPTAAALVAQLPRHAVAVGAPSEIVHRALDSGHDSAAMSMARQGLVSLASMVSTTSSSGIASTAASLGRARSRAEQRLYDALARDPRTAGQFELNVQVPIHEQERTVEVDLVAPAAQLAVEIDGWYHFRDPQGYRRDRVKDVWLQRAGFFVMRFLAEDVEQRLELIVDEIALGLGGRRASRSSLEDSL